MDNDFTEQTLSLLKNGSLSNNYNTVTTAVKQAIVFTKLYGQCITFNDVGSHCLRACGTIILKLDCISDTTIKVLGQWAHVAFEKYIH